MKRLTSWALVLGVLGTGAGCQRYHTLPLDGQAKEAALANPDMERIRVEARRLRHPLLQPLAIDPRGALSPEEAAVIAVLANPDLKAIRDQRALAAAQLLDAGLLPDPVLSYSQDTPVGGDDQGTVTARTFQVGLDLTSLLTRGARRRAAQAEQGAVDLEVAWQEWQVAQAAKLSAFRLATLEPQVQGSLELVALLEETLRALEPAAASGAAPLGDAVLAQAALDAGRRDALALGQERDRERQTLNGLLGLSPRTPLPLARLLRQGAWEGLPPEEVLLRGLEQRLDLVALEKGYESEDARVRLAVWSQFPSIGLSWSRARDTSNVVTRGTGVSMSLPLFSRGQGLVAVENATRRQLYDQYLARLVHARADVVQGLSGLAALRGMIGAAQGALPGLEAQAAASETAFCKGSLDLPGRNQARMALLSQRATLEALHRDLDELGVALEIASGRTLSHSSKEAAR